MKSFFIVPACVLALVSAASCATSGPAPASKTAPAATEPAIATIDYAPSDGGFLLFSTNDVANCRGGNGAFEKALGSASPFGSLEVEIAKDSGKSGYMYGIYFCRADAGHFYRLLVNPNGNYELLKCDGHDVRWRDFAAGSWVDLGGRNQGCYPIAGSFKAGLGVVNTVEVVAAGSGSFDLYFNGAKTASFSDTDFAGGGYGLMTFVGTAKDEDFPAIPVSGRYHLVSAR